MKIAPYLTFNGNCREAMTFYKECLGGDLDCMRFGDMPADAQGDVKGDFKDRIMHAKLHKGDFLLMASDNHPKYPDVAVGDNVNLSVDCGSREELQKVFKALSAKGKVTMEPQDTFWGAYFGMLVDKYGIHWMFNCEHKAK